MKKIILTAAAFFAFSFANAQIKTDAGTFTKPTAGSTQVEVSFSPDVTGGPSMFSLPNFYGSTTPGVKVRKFSSDTKAMRYIANVSMSKANSDADTDFTMALGVGVENHMKGAERLSTYWGYEGNVGYSSITTEATSPMAQPSSTATLGLSGQVFTGFDYYIMPNIYLGCELNYGLAILSKTPKGGEATTSIKLQPSVLPAMRLGWRF